MYRWIRNTHLLTGLFSFTFVLMFGISSIKFAHKTWFRDEPQVSERKILIAPEAAASPEALVNELMARHGLRGEMRGRGQANEKEIRAVISRPGITSQVTYSRQSGEATVRTTEAGFMGILTAIHDIYGLNHQFAVMNIWGLLLGFVSFGLMVLAVTGVYLWFKLKVDRVAGSVIAAVGLVFSLTLAVLLLVA